MNIFETYQLNAKIVPEGREEVIKYAVSMGDCVTIDDNGVITESDNGPMETKTPSTAKPQNTAAPKASATPAP